ncbi:MAG: C10 family peptidase [Alistipes sp.]|nr:C10 family peptidase [Alistipes sp.]
MKKILLVVLLLLSSSVLFAGPIGEQRARQIAEDFFASHSTRSVAGEITLEWAGDVIGSKSAVGSTLNSSLMYIFNKGSKDGFVVVAGDSNVEPIIAYSLNTTIDVDNMAEATEAILEAWCRQVESARQVAKPISGGANKLSTRSYDALLLETAIWNQSEPFNLEAPKINGTRSVTGCVATAMSIICYYHKWPDCGVGTTPEYSYDHSSGYTYTVPENKLGRTYEYSKMLSDYNNGYTTAQGNAVAALMKDMGTAVQMMYHPNGSGAYDGNVIVALAEYFKYAKSLRLLSGNSYTSQEWNDIIRENIKRYGPTYFSGMSATGGGHAFVVDGYDTENRFHFNFGWGGYGNGYFLIPSIEYYLDQAAIVGLEPDKDGTSTYVDDIQLIPLYSDNVLMFRGITNEETSYSQNVSFYSLLGGFRNNGIAKFNGSVKLVLCDKNGEWKQELKTYDITLSAGYYTYVNQWVSTTITTSLSEGDRLRIYYKGEYSDDWQWARGSDITLTNDELLVVASPKELAEGVNITYDKASKKLSFELKHASTVELVDAATGVAVYNGSIAARGGFSYDVKAGQTLICKFSLGSTPYELTLKF